jgi:hypothetical protein
MWVFSLDSRVVSRVVTGFDDGRVRTQIHGSATARVDRSCREHPAFPGEMPGDVGIRDSLLDAVGAPGSAQLARIGSATGLRQRNSRNEEVDAYVDLASANNQVLSACLATEERANETRVQRSDELRPAQKAISSDTESRSIRRPVGDQTGTSKA